MLITLTAELEEDDPHLAVGVTSTLPQPLPEDYVELPWHAQKHPRTGLRKRRAAVCTWLVEVHADQILELIGRVPDKQMLDILTKVAELDPPGSA